MEISYEVYKITQKIVFFLYRDLAAATVLVGIILVFILCHSFKFVVRGGIKRVKSRMLLLSKKFFESAHCIVLDTINLPPFTAFQFPCPV